MLLHSSHKTSGFARLYIAVSTIFIMLASAANATSLRAVGLDEMHTQAQYIFYGKCINNKVEKDEKTGFIVTYTTFEVIEKLKGKLKDQHTIKQIGGTLASGLRYQVSGVPRFGMSKEYIVYLPKKSKLGFSSPVALSQGQFRILKENGNKKLVSNGKEFSKLLKTTPNQKLTIKALNKKKEKVISDDEKKKNSHMELHAFKNLIKKMEQHESDDKDDKKDKKDKKDKDDKDDKDEAKQGADHE